MKTEKLKYFEGKICSVFTTQMNRSFRDDVFLNYFTGTVESVDEYGIMLRQLGGKSRTFIMMDHLASIAEEVMLDPNDTQDAQIIHKIKTSTQPPANAPPAKKESEKPAAVEKKGAVLTSGIIDQDELMALVNDYNRKAK